MGFRGTFTTSSFSESLPAWFVDRYRDTLHFGAEGYNGPLSSRFEIKCYEEILDDLSLAIKQIEAGDLTRIYPLGITCVMLWECGGVDRAEVSVKGVKWSCPTGWEATEGQTHNYCYGCSDVV
jgi:hypothetical protein